MPGKEKKNNPNMGMVYKALLDLKGDVGELKGRQDVLLKLIVAIITGLVLLGMGVIFI